MMAETAIERARRELVAAGRVFVEGVLVHADVTAEAVAEAVRQSHVGLDDPGFCISCGAEAFGVEPDARKYECEACGFPGVYGAEELVFYFF